MSSEQKVVNETTGQRAFTGLTDFIREQTFVYLDIEESDVTAAIELTAAQARQVALNLLDQADLADLKNGVSPFDAEPFEDRNVEQQIAHPTYL